LYSPIPIGQSQRQRKIKNEWAKELKSDPVLYKCGIEAKFGLVPSEIGVGYFCGHMVDYDEVGIYFLFAWAAMLHPYLLSFLSETRKCSWQRYDEKEEVMHTIKSKRLMGQKMRCGSQLVDSYIKDRRQDIRRFAKSMWFDSLMRAEQRRLKAANEKRAQDAREWEVARVEKQMLGNLAGRLSGSEW
jgi:hypothetical protein